MARAPSSPWNHTPKARRWEVSAGGEVVLVHEGMSASDAASAWFRAEAAEGRYPLRCNVERMVFRNGLKRPPKD